VCRFQLLLFLRRIILQYSHEVVRRLFCITGYCHSRTYRTIYILALTIAGCCLLPGILSSLLSFLCGCLLGNVPTLFHRRLTFYRPSSSCCCLKVESTMVRRGRLSLSNVKLSTLFKNTIKVRAHLRVNISLIVVASRTTHAVVACCLLHSSDLSHLKANHSIAATMTGSSEGISKQNSLPGSEDQQELEEIEHGGEDAIGQQPPPNNDRARCCCTVCYPFWALCPSIFLLILFVASTVLQFNDVDLSIMWSLFYLLHAILILSLLLLRQGWIRCTAAEQIKIVASCPAVGMIVWSLILICIASVDLSKVEEGGPEDGGDNESATEKEEVAYELAGACLGFLSASYHLYFLSFFCARSNVIHSDQDNI